MSNLRRAALALGLLVLLVGAVAMVATYPAMPRVNEIGVVPERTVLGFVTASGPILAARAIASRASVRRELAWLAFFAIALACTVFLAIPAVAEAVLLPLVAAIPESVRTSTFFRITVVPVLAYLILAPYAAWLYAGGVSIVRLIRAGWRHRPGLT